MENHLLPAPSLSDYGRIQVYLSMLFLLSDKRVIGSELFIQGLTYGWDYLTIIDDFVFQIWDHNSDRNLSILDIV